MMSFNEWINYNIDPKVAKRKYGDSFFPEQKANNRRNMAKIRLDRIRLKKAQRGSGDTESNLGSPTGSYNY